MAKSSLKTLERKARLPSRGSTLEISIAESEYQPSPELTKIASVIFILIKKEEMAAPIKVPRIVEIGKSQILFPKELKLAKKFLFFPISRPTKKSNKQRPISTIKSDLESKASFLKKKPKVIPKMTDRDIPNIATSPSF